MSLCHCLWPKIFSVTSASIFTFLKNAFLFWEWFLINALRNIDLVGYILGFPGHSFSVMALIIVCWLNPNFVVWPGSRLSTKFVKLGENEVFTYIFFTVWVCICVCAHMFNFLGDKLITKKRLYSRIMFSIFYWHLENRPQLQTFNYSKDSGSVFHCLLGSLEKLRA